jgi:hypothetical protein
MLKNNKMMKRIDYRATAKSGEKPKTLSAVAKNTVIMLVAAVMCGLFTVRAKAQTEPEFRRWSLAFGFSLHGSADIYPGGELRLSYSLSPHHRLQFGGSSHFSSEQVGTFSYYETLGGTVTNTYDDGKIMRNYNLTPVLFSWHYIHDFSPKLHLFAGPSLGITSIEAVDSYSTPRGTNIQGLPTDLRNESISAFTFAGNVGVIWDFARRWSLEAGYRMLCNGAQTLEMIDVNALSHQLNVLVAWRFGKVVAQ